MRRQEYEVNVPRSTGRAGFLKAITEILKLPRVQEIHVDANGRITCAQFLQDEEEAFPLLIDFDPLTPYSIIRNGKTREILSQEGDVGITAVVRMFHAAHMERLYPIAFATGGDTTLWKWIAKATGLESLSDVGEEERVLGFPIFRDRAIEDNVLFLCTGFGPGLQMSDTQKSFKLSIPEVT